MWNKELGSLLITDSTSAVNTLTLAIAVASHPLVPSAIMCAGEPLHIL
jgi:hypothetical protein